MNYMTVGGVIATMLIFTSCGNSKNSSSSNETPTNEPQMERFIQVTVNGDVMEQDNQAKLEWVGSAGANGNACQANPIADNEMGAVASAKDHCFSLVFAGYNDWRTPTAAEQSDMIKQMHAAGKIPFYTVPTCPRLMGVDGSTATAVNTHNSNPIGGLIPWATLLQQPKTNYGVKCVRNF